MNENLATIEKILEIKEIEGADKISAAKVLGYWTVVKKGSFKEGDLCVFHNPDCVVNAQNPVYAFLKGDTRLKVRKFRKQVSYGLVLPISDFADKLNISSVVEGQDVTTEIGITKYVKEIPINLRGQIEGNFPSFLRKTDALRIQNYYKALDSFNGKFTVITSKLDGTSFTAYLKDEKFGVCSRNLELKEEEGSIYWQMARKYKIEEALRAFRAICPGDFACQGEIYGQGIRKNNMKKEGVGLALFDLFSINHQRYANYDTLVEFCLDNNLEMVQCIWAGKFNFTLEELEKMADEHEYSPGVIGEGIVVKTAFEEPNDFLGSRSMFKVISSKYALKYGE